MPVTLSGQATWVSGRVVERASQQPIEFATIMVTDGKSLAPLTGSTTGPRWHV